MALKMNGCVASSGYREELWKIASRCPTQLFHRGKRELVRCRRDHVQPMWGKGSWPSGDTYAAIMLASQMADLIIFAASLEALAHLRRVLVDSVLRVLFLRVSLWKQAF